MGIALLPMSLLLYPTLVCLELVFFPLIWCLTISSLVIQIPKLGIFTLILPLTNPGHIKFTQRLWTFGCQDIGHVFCISQNCKGMLLFLTGLFCHLARLLSSNRAPWHFACLSLLLPHILVNVALPCPSLFLYLPGCSPSLCLVAIHHHLYFSHCNSNHDLSCPLSCCSLLLVSDLVFDRFLACSIFFIMVLFTLRTSIIHY